MKRLNKTTYRMEQSLEAYSCSCSCTITSNCSCSCPDTNQDLRSNSITRSTLDTLDPNSSSVDSSARAHAVSSPFIICFS